MTANSTRHSGFLSSGDLEDKIVEFIEHHDEYLASPYTWTLIVKDPTVYGKVG